MGSQAAELLDAPRKLVLRGVLALWPDLIVRILGGEKAEPGKKPGYRFEAPLLKEGEQRLDGVLVPPVEIL